MHATRPWPPSAVRCPTRRHRRFVGAVWAVTAGGRTMVALDFRVAHGKIVSIEVVADPVPRYCPDAVPGLPCWRLGSSPRWLRHPAEATHDEIALGPGFISWLCRLPRAQSTFSTSSSRSDLRRPAASGDRADSGMGARRDKDVSVPARRMAMPMAAARASRGAPRHAAYASGQAAVVALAAPKASGSDSRTRPGGLAVAKRDLLVGVRRLTAGTATLPTMRSRAHCSVRLVHTVPTA